MQAKDLALRLSTFILYNLLKNYFKNYCLKCLKNFQSQISWTNFQMKYFHQIQICFDLT